MVLRRWDRIQQGRGDSLPVFRRGFRNEIKRITNLVNGILELENKLVSKLERISKMSTNQVHANLM